MDDTTSDPRRQATSHLVRSSLVRTGTAAAPSKASAANISPNVMRAAYAIWQRTLDRAVLGKGIDRSEYELMLRGGWMEFIRDTRDHEAVRFGGDPRKILSVLFNLYPRLKKTMPALTPAPQPSARHAFARVDQPLVKLFRARNRARRPRAGRERGSATRASASSSGGQGDDSGGSSSEPPAVAPRPAPVCPAHYDSLRPSPVPTFGLEAGAFRFPGGISMADQQTPPAPPPSPQPQDAAKPPLKLLEGEQPTTTRKKKRPATDNAVWLPRALMAERVGMTPMAFSKRFGAVALPSGVAVRHGRSWYYNVEKFLSWFSKGGR